jgi:N-acetylglucosamine-6-phosphate deacetylase
MMSLLLKNANVVLPDREVPGGSVFVREGSIVSFEPEQADEEIDLAGATLLPGFIDFHIHGAAGIDVMDATASELGEVSQYLASQGVTSWVPTFVPASDENYASAIVSISEAMCGPGARMLGVHYEGPFVNLAQCGALHTEYFKTYSGAQDLDSLPLPATGVRMTTLAPEVSGGIELVRELTARGWVVSIGHTRADVALLDAACEAGAHHMTHFMNAMAPLHHRSPGPIAWGLSRDDVTVDCIADGIHLDPFMLRLLLKIKGAGRISLISDAIAAAGKGDGDYQIWGETIFVKNGRTANASGNIAGSVISMLDAVRMMHSLGVSYVDLARISASNPARLLGLDNVGSIELGKRADLVALDNSNDPVLTVIGGKVFSGRE